MQSFQSILRKYVQQNSSVNPRQTAQGFLRIGGLGGAFNFGILSAQADRADRDDKNFALLEAARNADRQDQLDALSRKETLATIAARNAQTKASEATIEDIPTDNAREDRKIGIAQQNADTARTQANRPNVPSAFEQAKLEEIKEQKNQLSQFESNVFSRVSAPFVSFAEIENTTIDEVISQLTQDGSFAGVPQDEIDQIIPKNFSFFAPAVQQKAAAQLLQNEQAKRRREAQQSLLEVKSIKDVIIKEDLLAKLRNNFGTTFTSIADVNL